MTLLLSSSCSGLAANKKADARMHPHTDCVCMHKHNNQQNAGCPLIYFTCSFLQSLILQTVPFNRELVETAGVSIKFV